MNYYDLLKQHTLRHANKMFLRIDGTAYTYNDFLAYTDNLAEDVSSQVRAGQDILILANGFERQFAAFLALQKLGARPILAHDEHELTSILRDNHLQGLWRLSETENDFTFTGEVIRTHKEADILGVLSSGSTGTPKVMYRTYDSWAGFFPTQNRIFDVDGNTVMFLQGSLSFTGNTNSALSVLFEGGTIVTSEYMRCRGWGTLIEDAAVTCIYLVPAKLTLFAETVLRKHPDVASQTQNRSVSDTKSDVNLPARQSKSTIPTVKKTFPSVKSLFTGSQLLTPSVIRYLQSILPHAKLILYYGASELNYITYAVVDKPDRVPENLGHPFPGIGLSIKGGLIYVDTPYHVSGVKIPFSVHDTGWLNENGELIFGGRRGAWVNKGGYKLNLLKLETELKSLPGITDAAVLPVRDKLRGEGAGVWIVKDPGTNESQLRQTIRHFLKPADMPDFIRFIDRIPLNNRGKVDADKLRRFVD